MLATLAVTLIAALSILAGRGVSTLAQEGSATPAAATPLPVDFAQLVAQRPVEIRSGDCEEPGEPIAALTPLESPDGEAQGQGEAIEAERSYTEVPIAVESLVQGQTTITVLLAPDDIDTTIACGEIGGVPDDSGSLIVKLSERNKSGFTGIAYLAPVDIATTGASVFLAGSRSVAETRDLIAATPETPLAPLVAPTPTAEPVQIVDVVLLEWLIDMPAETRAGQVNFVVTNEGAEAHGLVIESGGAIVAELPAALDPGDSNILSATLAPGDYVVYCPLGEGDHRGQGMEATLLVVP